LQRMVLRLPLGKSEVSVKKVSSKPFLYFVALIPGEELSGRIITIKKDFAERYESMKALKIIPHITLQNPFKRNESAEVELHLRLQDFFSAFHSFSIDLSGFGCFEKRNKVIFIDVVKNNSLFDLHKKLIHFLREEMHFSESESSFMYHPHVTVALKDLTNEQFVKAWMHYKNKTFEGSFVADAVYLLKHDYRKWNVLSKFILTNR
jgi:2'-5' RNA ligase